VRFRRHALYGRLLQGCLAHNNPPPRSSMPANLW
jgi:hypothetical protein